MAGVTSSSIASAPIMIGEGSPIVSIDGRRPKPPKTTIPPKRKNAQAARRLFPRRLIASSRGRSAAL